MVCCRYEPPRHAGAIPGGRKLFGGVIAKFQRGQGGFSAVWKQKWVAVEKGVRSP
jgi:hypothetical protein